MSSLDQMRFRAPQNLTADDIPPGFSGPELLPVTEEDCDRILKLISDAEQDEKDNKTKKAEKSIKTKQNEKSNKRKKAEKKTDTKKVEKKKPVDEQLPQVDSEPEEHVISLNTYQPRPATKAKVIRKQLNLSGASPYFSGSSNKQVEPKKVVANNTNNSPRYFQAVYGKDKPYKKHKVFSDDGYVIVKKTVVELRDDSKKYIGKIESWDSHFPKTYDDSTRFICAGYLVEFSNEITEQEYNRL